MDWKEYLNTRNTLEDYMGILWAHSVLLDEIVKEEPQNILEIGAGTSIMSIFLSWLGFKVTAVDNDPNILEKAKALCAKLNGNVTYVFCDIFQLEDYFKLQKFDLIFSQGVIEHFDNSQINGIIKQQQKIANKIIISVPSKFYPIKDFGNERLLSLEVWKKIMIDSKISLIKYYGFVPSKKSIHKGLLNPLVAFKILLNIFLKRAQILIKIDS